MRKFSSVSLLGIFFECVETRNLWLGLASWLAANNIVIPCLSVENIIFGNTSTHGLNTIILVTKYYICTTRCLGKNVSLSGLKACLKSIYMLLIKI